MMQNISIGNKDQRLQPRKPAYLRQSFDLTEWQNGNSVDSIQSHFNVSKDESKPRHKPPEPTTEARWKDPQLLNGLTMSTFELSSSSEDDILPSKSKVYTKKPPHIGNFSY